MPAPHDMDAGAEASSTGSEKGEATWARVPRLDGGPMAVQTAEQKGASAQGRGSRARTRQARTTCGPPDPRAAIGGARGSGAAAMPSTKSRPRHDTARYNTTRHTNLTLLPHCLAAWLPDFQDRPTVPPCESSCVDSILAASGTPSADSTRSSTTTGRPPTCLPSSCRW